MFSVYILTNKPNGTLYIGMTNNLKRRVYEHKQKLVDGFTKKYDVNTLVYYEVHETVESAITREKQLKHWNRLWKLKLVNEFNPEWDDLYNSL